MTTMAPETQTGSVTRERTNRSIWFVAVAVLAVLAMVGAWFIFDDAGAPTVTFDGTEAVYDGPTTFDAGEVEFHYDVSEYEPGVAIIVAQLLDDDITLDDVKAHAEVSPATEVPDFIGFFNITYVTEDSAEDRVVDKMVRLNEDNRYLITANTSSTDTNRVFPAAIIEVK